jgi:undecaprenyl-diphosphatase
MGVIEAIIYGIVQGVTEWLPISSTAHLRIVPALMGRPDPGAAFTATIQLGTILAVLIYFRDDLKRAISAWFRSFADPAARKTADAKLAWGAFWGTFPIVGVALLLQNYIEGELRSLYVIAGMLIGFGLVMWWADTYKVGQRNMESVSIKDGLIVGLFQCLSLIPGTSRSGSTMTGAYLIGFDRATAARLSFLLSVPSITAAGIYQIYKHRDEILNQSLTPILVATFVSFVVGYATIAWLIKFLQKRGLGVFVGYRILLGIALIVLVQSGVIPAVDASEPEAPTVTAKR